jgi:ribose transport system permease protein
MSAVETETPAVESPGAADPSRRSPAALALAVLPSAVLVVMVVVFSVQADSFLTARNLTLLSGQAGVLLLSALGLTLVVVIGSIDLSIGSIVLLTGAVLAKLMAGGLTNPLLVVLIAIAIGAAVGAVNGVVFAYGRVPSFIATLGSLSLLSGLALTLINGRAVSFTAPGVQNLAIGQAIPHVQNSALFGIGALAILWFLSRRTRAGVYLYAIGGGEDVVRLSGVRVNRYKTLAFVLSGVTVAIAGMLITAQLGSIGPDAGSSTMLDALAAIVIGGTALSGGVGGVGRTLLGVLLITVLANGLNQMGVADFTQTMIKGAVIIVAALFTMASQRRLTIK